MNNNIQMSQENPFAKLVANPSSVPDPNKITLQQFQKYNSLEVEKLNTLSRTVKRSGKYMGGVLGLCLVAGWWAEKKARCELFGADNKGGSYLDLLTWRDEAHYAYNREFQRMFHLAETQTADASIHSQQLLTDLGVKTQAHGAPNIKKKSAHEKFF